VGANLIYYPTELQAKKGTLQVGANHIYYPTELQAKKGTLEVGANLGYYRAYILCTLYAPLPRFTVDPNYRCVACKVGG
jgi:hypothetical protein